MVSVIYWIKKSGNTKKYNGLGGFWVETLENTKRYNGLNDFQKEKTKNKIKSADPLLAVERVRVFFVEIFLNILYSKIHDND